MKREILVFILLMQIMALRAQVETNEIDSENLEKLIAFCDTTTEATEVLIIHKNKQIAHWRDAACDSAFMTTSSMLKSWTGLVVGILIDKKIIESLDAPVSKYIP